MDGIVSKQKIQKSSIYNKYNNVGKMLEQGKRFAWISKKNAHFQKCVEISYFGECAKRSFTLC